MVRGRPLAKIDWKIVDKYLQAQCTAVGIASLIGVNESTLRKRCEEDNKMLFSEYQQIKRAEGQELLRAKQFSTAMTGCKTMLVWLGKQYLGQRDRQEVEHTGSVPVHPSDMTEEQRKAREAELLSKLC